MHYPAFYGTITLYISLQPSMNLPPKKPLNRDRRTREYFMPDEVESLMKAARHVGKHHIRDYTLILMMYRHVLL
jgi:hypothetical protein